MEEILDRLERVKKNGAQWIARCPAHEDNRPSLSVREDADVILLHCFAGCRTADICARIGIEVSDLFNRPLPERSRPMPMKKKQPPRPDAELIERDKRYTEALYTSPELLERLLKRRPWRILTIEKLGLGFDAETKRITFPVRVEGILLGHLRWSPGGQEPKTIADPGVPRVLFPEPTLLPDEGRVWIVEGEPDAVTMWSHDYPAVGVPGTQAWKDEWADFFIGRSVAIMCDDDEPGHELADEIEHSVGTRAMHVSKVSPADVVLA